MGWGFLKEIGKQAGGLALQGGILAAQSAIQTNPVAAAVVRQLAKPDAPGEGGEAGAVLIRQALASYFSPQSMKEIDALVLAWADGLRADKDGDGIPDILDPTPYGGKEDE